MRILLVTNSGIERFGYSIVGSKIADALQEAGHQVIYLGLQTLAPPFKKKNGMVVIGVKFDEYGSDVIENYLRIYKCDCMLTILDVWNPKTYFMPEVCEFMGVKWIAHATIFTDPMSPLLFNNIRKADYIVAPSKFNMNMLVKEGLSQISAYIPHGVDTTNYRPDKEIKETWKHKLTDKLMFLTVQRNKGQIKDFPALFKAWSIALSKEPRMKEEAVLYALTDPIEVLGPRLDIIRSKFGLKDHIKFVFAKPSDNLNTFIPTYEGDIESMPHHANAGFNDVGMNILYNCADVYIGSSRCESFGLPIIEAQACGVPCIVPNSATGPELVGESRSGLLCNISQSITNQDLMGEEFLIDVNDMAEKIVIMFRNKELRKELSINARSNALDYDWCKIMPKWLKLFNVVENDLNRTDYGKGILGF